MEFSLEMLAKTIESYTESTNKTKTNDNTVFLPNGTHKGRFIIDKSGKEFFTSINTFGFFSAGIRDPKDCSNVTEGFENLLVPLYWDYLKYAQKWSRNRSTTVLAYFYLVDTDSPSENWQPGNLYCIIGKKKFGDAVAQFFANIVREAPEAAIPMLNPESETPLLTISSTPGREGGISISVAFPQKTAPAVDVSKFEYTDLQHAYIGPGFDHDKYNKLVARYINEIRENASYIIEKRFEEQEQARMEEAAEKGEVFVAGTKPTELVIEVNGVELTPEMFGGKSDTQSTGSSEASETPAHTASSAGTQQPAPAPVSENEHYHPDNQTNSAESSSTSSVQKNPDDLFAQFNLNKQG